MDKQIEFRAHVETEDEHNHGCVPLTFFQRSDFVTDTELLPRFSQDSRLRLKKNVLPFVFAYINKKKAQHLSEAPPKSDRCTR